MSLRPKTLEEARARQRAADERRRQRLSERRKKARSSRAAAPLPPPPPSPSVDTSTPAASPAVRTVSAAPREVRPAIDKAARWRSRAYLDSVKRDPCEACLDVGQRTPAADAHHVRVRGTRDDTCDLLVIPVCRSCHDEAHAGRIPTDYLRQLLAGYLCRKLLQLSRSEAAVVLRELLAAVG